MTIIFEDTNSYINYLQPENILWIRICRNSEYYIRYAVVNTKDKYKSNWADITKTTVGDILNQLEQQHYKFIDINEKLGTNSADGFYINLDAIESIRTYDNYEFGLSASIEIKTKLKYYNVEINKINLEKTKQFIKSLTAKK